MLTLLRFEIRKIALKKPALIAFLCMVLCIVTISIMTTTSHYLIDENENRLSGIAAISLERKQTAELEGYLTPELFVAALAHYQEIVSNPDNLNDNQYESHIKMEVYNSELGKYNNILEMMRYILSPRLSYDYYILSKITEDDAKSFYEVRSTLMEYWMNQDRDQVAGKFTEAEREFYLHIDSQIKTPYYYAYTKGWNYIMENGFYLILMMVLFISCICISPVFASEYQTGADSIILSSRYGKNKVIMAKTLASLIYITCVYIIAMLLFLIIMLSIYGWNGWNAPIQIERVYSPYALTILEVYLYSIAMGYTAALAVTAIVLLLSSVLRAPFHVIIIGVLWIFIPIFIPSYTKFPLINQIIVLFPAHVTDIITYFVPRKAYELFGNVIPLPVMFILISLVTVVICLPIAYSRFKKRQV